MYDWDPDSTYVREPPFFDRLDDAVVGGDIEGARVLVKVGDSITTDHISPAGSIKADSPAGEYLKAHGVAPSGFNSYGARRGNHEVMMRGTFANIRLRNEMAPGTEGPWTTYLPDGDVMTVFDAAGRYREAGVPLAVIAGKEYGSGSSRDWAAKGPSLLGVRFVIAESYERIHRSNLVGMGVLPLQFARGGVGGVARPHRPRDVLGPGTGERRVTRDCGSRSRPSGKTGARRAFDAIVRIDGAAEVGVLRERRPAPDGASRAARPIADRVLQPSASSRAISSAHALIAFQSRKSPSGAFTAFTIMRSPNPSLLRSNAPKNMRCARRLKPLRQLRQLSRLLLVVLHLGPQRPAAEQPQRKARQDLRVGFGELRGLLHPRPGVDGAPQHHGVDAVEIGHVRGPDRQGVVSELAEPFGDGLRDALGRTVLAGGRDQDLHG